MRYFYKSFINNTRITFEQWQPMDELEKRLASLYTAMKFIKSYGYPLEDPNSIQSRILALEYLNEILKELPKGAKGPDK